jgi:hypothetical protein
MLAMDTLADKAAVARVPLARRDTLHGIALVLQVSPLHGTSNQDEFYYDPFANIETGDFAAAHAFFIHQGHTVIYHECPDVISFQELFSLASIGYISSLPEGLLAEGHELLAAQHCLLRATVHAVGTLPQGYIHNAPLPRFPLRQSPTSQIHTIPDYYNLPYLVPTYATPRSIVENAAYAFSPTWQAIAINT